ncbi:hypothetical protein ALC60_04447 [Trachymyrmex zeteki]|uniref:Uncharacterized protein n=1 Tax=Mycetomoellerius zeteki TaxID=64791 RepID=A0A151X896_9HYME|nr:hypothetical protein ALC60_04447 [Trachymyrmex zeteki]
MEATDASGSKWPICRVTPVDDAKQRSVRSRSPSRVFRVFRTRARPSSEVSVHSRCVIPVSLLRSWDHPRVCPRIRCVFLSRSPWDYATYGLRSVGESLPRVSPLVSRTRDERAKEIPRVPRKNVRRSGIVRRYRFPVINRGRGRRGLSVR